MPYLLVGTGGMMGAVLRYGISFILLPPYATIVVNLLGAFLLALLLTRTKRSLFFGTGVLGSFTTFSTFSYEVTQLSYIGAISYIMTTLIGGLLAATLGQKVGARRA
ncbi:MAG TPA: CrcB family protein [Metalysinibacillus jejuensis]|uniref:Fluoride-specific ion channel FluC n=1 Tax=Metalysinibacillus jejuensis TaxID=914327 RepID=A0A921NDM0_9BACL|nr:CrcB family protein [Metalysinibacillus jejuensis]